MIIGIFFTSHGAVLEKTFDGSLPKFLTAFLSGRKLSEQEAEELKRIIEEAVK